MNREVFDASDAFNKRVIELVTDESLDLALAIAQGKTDAFFKRDPSLVKLAKLVSGQTDEPKKPSTPKYEPDYTDDRDSPGYGVGYS